MQNTAVGRSRQDGGTTSSQGQCEVLGSWILGTGFKFNENHHEKGKIKALANISNSAVGSDARTLGTCLNRQGEQVPNIPQLVTLATSRAVWSSAWGM